MAEKQEMVDKILQLFESMKAERQPWADTVSEVLKYVIPGRASMQVTTSPQSYAVDRTSRDGTAKTAAYLMANGLLGNVCSQRFKWFRLKPERPEDENIPNAREWLDIVQDVFYHILATGNFYSGAWQNFLDAATAGLGSMFMTEDLNETTVNFSTFAPKGAYIATNSLNKIDTYVHHLTMTARDILEEYPDASFTDDFKGRADKKPFDRYEVIHAIFPRKDRDIYKIDNLNMPFASVHILKAPKTLLRESGFNSFPMSCFRYEYDSEEVYPHSPSIDGFADIQRLDRTAKATTDVAQITANPPFAVPSEIYNDFELKPNFKIRAFDMNRLPHPLQTGQNYPIGRDREELYQQQVRDHYFANFFLMLAASENPQMTATEVLERQGEKATVIGGMTARLTSEFLDPIFDRLFVICSQNNWIPEPPEELLRRNVSIKIDYLGPLAQAQQRFLKLQGPMSAMQNFLPLVEAYPQMLDILDPAKFGRHILIEGGMPASLLRSEREYRAIVNQKLLEAQQAQQAEVAEKEAKALKDGAVAPDPGSASEAVLNEAGVG